ncbi:MAG: hydrogenase formation protein HypD [Candidatus Calescibacterium sp.]|nr:hydrogenase formation protein HypD [Candidatus Calescibacterium sp.]MCX7971622.1 hydrogenase formation protein HypD [bacterium]MDW8195830.1 hydrogenase formation protein HypD [Candidatus Calescibacterium sp.]
MTNLAITKKLTKIGKEEVKFLIEQIHKLASDREYCIMEFCGTHTHEISRYGIRSILPKTLDLKSGPGCPVCVTAAEDIDYLITIAEKYDLGVITFGDIVNVPGSRGSLSYLRARGKEVRVVYSPIESLKIAKQNPTRNYILVGIGFETTVPGLAYTVKKIVQEGIKNLFYFSLHKLTPPAMKALLDAGEIKLDGIIGPGHVSTVIGIKKWQEFIGNYQIPFVIMGFEPEDIIYGIYILMQKIKNKEYGVFNTYFRSVRFEGNVFAQKVVDEVFEVSDSNWRGLGVIPQSGLELRKEYSHLDVKKIFKLDEPIKVKKTGCRCGEVLRGVIKPYECPLFEKVCRPDNPKGPCMVSSEGTCAAYYLYEKE